MLYIHSRQAVMNSSEDQVQTLLLSDRHRGRLERPLITKRRWTTPSEKISYGLKLHSTAQTTFHLSQSRAVPTALLQDKGIRAYIPSRKKGKTPVKYPSRAIAAQHPAGQWTNADTSGVIALRSCSEDSRTGGVWPPAMTGARRFSFWP